MKTIIGKCPGLVDFFGYQDNQLYTFKDTVSIYDLFELYVKKIVDYHPIVTNDDNILIPKIIKEFFDYTQIKDYKVIVNFVKNIPEGLNGNISDALGILLALNMYFKTELKDEDMKNICINVDESLLPYINLLERKNEEHEQFNLFVTQEENKLLLELRHLKEELVHYKAKLIGIGETNSFVLSFNNHHDRFLANTELKENAKVKTFPCRSGQGFVINAKYK